MSDMQASSGPVASNPANIRMHWPTYLSYRWKWPAIWFAVVVLGIAATYFTWCAVPVPLFGLLALFLYWRFMNGHARRGDTNPAVVISMDPPLMAVLVDLRLGMTPYPTVKVMPVEDIDDDMKVGFRLPVITSYWGNPDKNDKWDDVKPIPAQVYTNNDIKVQERLASFSREDWQELKYAVAQVPKPYKPGLYPVQLTGQTAKMPPPMQLPPQQFSQPGR